MAEGRALGAIVREAREKAGLTQLALAERVGLAPNHIVRIESGERIDVRFSTIARIAGVLHLSLDSLAVACGYRARAPIGGGAAVEGLLDSVHRARAAAEAMQHAAETAAHDILAASREPGKRQRGKPRRR